MRSRALRAPSHDFSKVRGAVIPVGRILLRIVEISSDPDHDGRFRISAELANNGSQHSRTEPTLTKREEEIALHLSARESTEEIAEALGITKHTVRRHIERIFSKLGVRSRAGVRRAVHRGGQ